MPNGASRSSQIHHVASLAIHEIEKMTGVCRRVYENFELLRNAAIGRAQQVSKKASKPQNHEVNAVSRESHFIREKAE